jgi:hypothetical protein
LEGFAVGLIYWLASTMAGVMGVNRPLGHSKRQTTPALEYARNQFVSRIALLNNSELVIPARMEQLRKLVSVFLLLVSTCAEAGTSYNYGMGGSVEQFDTIVRQVDRSGEQFRIEGDCQSACTMFLRVKNVCVERDATLLFHAAKSGTPLTNRMLSSYRPGLRSYLTANHFMDTSEFHSISGAEIIQKFGYRECPKK